MHKTLASLMMLGALAVPAGATAFPGQPHVHPFRNHIPRKVARATCSRERTTLGVVAFRLRYGKPNAFNNCVRSKLPTTRAATLTCLAQRKALGARVFRLDYPGRNPIRVCVRIATGA